MGSSLKPNALAEYCCADCRKPMLLLPYEGELQCDNPRCSRWGMPLPLWRLEQQRAAAAGEPELPLAGLPRPVAAGRPVPWITPFVGGRAWWRSIHGERVLRCQLEWRCQVCGLDLEPLAWVMVDDLRQVLTPAAMHEQCVDSALAQCPYLKLNLEYRAVLVGREDIIVANGAPLTTAPAPLEWQSWTVRVPTS